MHLHCKQYYWYKSSFFRNIALSKGYTMLETYTYIQLLEWCWCRWCYNTNSYRMNNTYRKNCLHTCTAKLWYFHSPSLFIIEEFSTEHWITKSLKIEAVEHLNHCQKQIIHNKTVSELKLIFFKVVIRLNFIGNALSMMNLCGNY